MRPTQAYLSVVTTALEEHGLDTSMLKAAAENRPIPSFAGLFVYGTLMRGECRFHLLAKHGLQCVLLAETQGRLVDLGDYPGMLPPAPPDQWVQGEFVRVDRLGAALDVLDAVEGFRGYGKPGSLYRRVLTTAGLGDGRARSAWTYVLNESEPSAPVVPSGDWRVRQAKRETFLDRLVAAHCGTNQEEVAQRLAQRGPFPPYPNEDGAVRRLLPLAHAIERGEVSERELAQATGKWTVVPH